MARRPVPADLEDALAESPAARERFWALPPEQLDRWVSYVERARFPGQRRRRVARTVTMLGGEVAPEPAVAGGPIPRDTVTPWLVGLLLLGGLAAFLVWWTVYRDDDKSATPAAVVVTAKGVDPKVTGIRLEAAQFQLSEAKLGSKVVRRNATKPKGIVVAQSPKPEKKVAAGTVVTLVVSKGPEGVRVPKLVGLAAADAVRQLQEKGLGVQLQQTSAQAAPGTVVEQSPQPGKRAKRGTPVVLSVAKGAAAVVVPDVHGHSESDAVHDLQQRGLNVNVVKVASQEPAGTVVAQSPQPGAKVQQGGTVRINVARQAPATTATTRTTTTPSPTTTVRQSPSGNDYRGMRLDDAVQKIAEGRQQVVVEYVTSSERPNVVVANSKAGNRVRLQVSAGAKPKPATEVPDTSGLDSASAQDELTKAGFSVLTVDWPVSDPASDGVVVYQTPTAPAPRGSTIVLYIGVTQ
jgi:beta-lactam-binding protein with PASTA domain